MSESLVRLRHFMGLLTSLNRRPLSSSCIHQFASKFLRHCFSCAGTSRTNQPAHRQRVTSFPAYINGHLVSRTTDTAGFHFHATRRILQRLLKHIERLPFLPGLNKVKTIVYYTLGQASVSLQH